MKDLKEIVGGCKGIYYFHMMKTGGTYMKKNLKILCDKAGIDLICSSTISPCFEYVDNPIPEGYIKVSTVREPTAMLASYWEYMKFSNSPSGKKDSGFLERAWMQGRRLPFETFSEFMDYFTIFGDFSYMVEDANHAWPYTLETGIHRLKLIYNQLMKLALYAAQIRPPQRFHEIRRKILKDIEDTGYFTWKNPNTKTDYDRHLQDTYSFYWFCIGPDETALLTRENFSLRLARLHTSFGYPWRASKEAGWENCTTNFLPPTMFVLSNAYHSFTGWWPCDPPDDPNFGMMWRDYNIGSDTTVPIDDIVSLWEYVLSPYHKLFKLDNGGSSGSAFDIILKQERLTESFEELKKAFNVDFDSSKKIKVTKDRRAIEGMLSAEELSRYNTYFERERKLFGYDDPALRDKGIWLKEEISHFFKVNASSKMQIKRR